MDEEVRKIIELSTVSVVSTDKKGMGVIVPGEFVLTAAHCIRDLPEMCKGYAILGIHFTQNVKTGWKLIREYEKHIGQENFVPAREDIDTFELELKSIEPFSDIAVLSLRDFHNVPETDPSEMIFDMEKLWPVTVFLDEVGIDMQFDVHVYTHLGTWIDGKATLRDPKGSMMLSFNEPILSGTSGSPVVNCDGQLVCLVSNTFDDSGQASSTLLSSALPGWVRKRIASWQRDM